MLGNACPDLEYWSRGFPRFSSQLVEEYASRETIYWLTLCLTHTIRSSYWSRAHIRCKPGSGMKLPPRRSPHSTTLPDTPTLGLGHQISIFFQRFFFIYQHILMIRSELPHSVACHGFSSFSACEQATQILRDGYQP